MRHIPIGFHYIYTYLLSNYIVWYLSVIGMKSINVQFGDDEWELLKSRKDKTKACWRDYILEATAALEREIRCKDDGR